MTAPLGHQIILNTRPAHQQAGLSAMLEADGARVLSFPAIEIVLSAADETAIDPADYDILLFVSRNAVDGAMRLIDSRQLPAGLRYGVIGSATRAALLAQIGDADASLIESEPYNSEALLRAEALKSVKGKSILILRGQQGRNLLGDELAARGAHVDYREVYRRELPTLGPEDFNRLVAATFPTLVVFTSNEGMLNLFELIDAAAAARLLRTPWLLISERMRESALKLGHNAEILVATEASDAGIHGTICAWAASDVTPAPDNQSQLSMKKKDDTDEKDTPTELIATDPDPVQIGAETDAATDSESKSPVSAADAGADADRESAAPAPEADESGDSAVAAADNSDETASDTGDEKTEESAANEEPGAQKPPPEPRPRRSWFGLFNFLLILLLAGAAGYYWWLEQRVKRDYDATITDLRAEIAARAGSSRVEELAGGLATARRDLGALKDEVGALDTAQEDLRAASEKLYELFGRDKNDWQLAEVEYLMRVAQHKLILQDDFEGAAITLQAASDKIALTADPGLLPVRVKISEEIADLKTRKRADLVGMTLILAQLAQQARVLEPGFEPRIDEAAEPPPSAPGPDESLIERVSRVVDSLVTISYQGDRKPTEVEASVVNIGETLEDNLKLARWSVLDRDAFQYQKLIDETVRLFREFYDLDNAANRDFLDQLQDLQKMQLRPEKPDIGGSLRELQRILSQRDNAPDETAPAAAETSDG